MEKIYYWIFSLVLIIGMISVFYKLVLWAKKRSKGAFIFAMFLPLISVQPIPPPSYENIEEAKKEKKDNEGDSGDSNNPENS